MLPTERNGTAKASSFDSPVPSFVFLFHYSSKYFPSLDSLWTASLRDSSLLAK